MTSGPCHSRTPFCHVLPPATNTPLTFPPTPPTHAQMCMRMLCHSSATTLTSRTSKALQALCTLTHPRCLLQQQHPSPRAAATPGQCRVPLPAAGAALPAHGTPHPAPAAALAPGQLPLHGTPPPPGPVGPEPVFVTTVQQSQFLPPSQPVAPACARQAHMLAYTNAFTKGVCKTENRKYTNVCTYTHKYLYTHARM